MFEHVNNLIKTIIGIWVIIMIITAMFVPQIAGWKSDLSCVNATDYGFIIDIIVLLVLLTPLWVGLGLLLKGKKF
jgi:hypothetical protein